MPTLILILKITILSESLFHPSLAQAYIGPGLGLGAIGAIIGVILSIILGLLGLVWYPLKRLFSKNQRRV